MDFIVRFCSFAIRLLTLPCKCASLEAQDSARHPSGLGGTPPFPTTLDHA